MKFIYLTMLYRPASHNCMKELWVELRGCLGLCSDMGLSGDLNVICWVWKSSRTAELEVRMISFSKEFSFSLSS